MLSIPRYVAPDLGWYGLVASMVTEPLVAAGPLGGGAGAVYARPSRSRNAIIVETHSSGCSNCRKCVVCGMKS